MGTEGHSVTGAGAGRRYAQRFGQMVLATGSALVLMASVPLAGADVSRGRLLYENHCIACHDTQIHWRQNRRATDWASLRVQVREWQTRAHLNWSDADIDAVARYLNDSIYHLGRPERRTAAGY